MNLKRYRRQARRQAVVEVSIIYFILTAFLGGYLFTSDSWDTKLVQYVSPTVSIEDAKMYASSIKTGSKKYNADAAALYGILAVEGFQNKKPAEILALAQKISGQSPEQAIANYFAEPGERQQALYWVKSFRD